MNALMSTSGDKSTLFSNLNVFSSSPKTEDDKVKTKLMSMWNNMKYGMKLKTNFSKESPVWLLGKCYYKKIDNPETTELGTDIAAFSQSQSNITRGLEEEEEEGIEGFKQDFLSKIWMTYRREFPILNGSNYSSDCGWGCMLRSGQMMLAQALVCHFLGRDWRWNPDTIMTTSHGFLEEITHRKILKWFGDKPSINSPLSIHSLVNIGESSGKKAGDWYGPANVAHILKQAVKLASKDNVEFDSITVCVAQDCAVYINDVLEECEGKDGKWKSLILLVPARLGAEKFNEIYGPCLTGLLTLEECIGIIGGRPKHSLYFIGYQDDKLIHLDPHYCQDMVDVWSSDFPLSSFHCKSPRKMHLSKMDPSCCIGFYCSTKDDFFTLIENAKSLLIPPSRNAGIAEYPMFVFCEGYSKDSHVTHRINNFNQPLGDVESDIDTEEFEVL